MLDTIRCRHLIIPYASRVRIVHVKSTTTTGECNSIRRDRLCGPDVSFLWEAFQDNVKASVTPSMK